MKTKRSSYISSDSKPRGITHCIDVRCRVHQQRNNVYRCDTGHSNAAGAAAQTETLTLTGSTTVLPIAQAVADAYTKAHPEANIQVSGGGSGVGIQAIINKKVDIGMSSADVSAAQKAQDSNMNIITIAHDGIAIIVNPANTVQSISLAQVQQIYSGNITSWSSLSGAGVSNSNNQIVLVGRDSSSGTGPISTVPS